MYVYQQLHACKHDACAWRDGDDTGIVQAEKCAAVIDYASQIFVRNIRDIIARYGEDFTLTAQFGISSSFQAHGRALLGPT